MAKTFKNLPRPGEPTAPKPTSERDFFDLTEELAPAKKAVGKAEKAHNTRNTSNSDNIGNTSNSGNITASDSPRPGTSPSVIATTGSEGVRQTFVLNRGHLEQLRDYGLG